jgi:hypothetical protein
MIDTEKDFYAHLGLLSTKFARLEQNIISILSLLTTFDPKSVFGLTLFEKNPLSKNLDVLRKTINIRSFDRSNIDLMIKDIEKLKDDRNMFIHGIWGNPYTNSDGEISVICDNRKIKYQQQQDGSQHWRLNENVKFTLPDIKERISKLEEIVEFQDKYIHLLTEHLLDQGIGDFYW